MPKHVRVSSIDRTARHVRRESHTIRHLRFRATMCILIVLVAVWGVYTWNREKRLSAQENGVEVVVGSTLMARIELAADGEGVPVLAALEEVSVYPTSQQTIVITGDGLRVEVVARNAGDYRLAARDGETLLTDAEGESLGVVKRVYLPTGPESLQAPQ